MGRKCVVNACNNRQKKRASVMFHRFPPRPGHFMLWLIALNTDPNTPIEVIKRMSICSEHFTRGDYFERMQHSSQNGRITKTMRLVLKDTAVPSVEVWSGATPPLSVDQCIAEGETSGVHQDPLAMETPPSDMDDAPPHSGVPHQRTPQKTSASSGVRPQMTLQLTSPAQAEPRGRTSRSGTCFSPPPPPTTQQTGETEMEPSSHTPGLASSQESSLDTAPPNGCLDITVSSYAKEEAPDSSFGLFSSPSSSASSASSPVGTGWKERKWIVNESKLMELFHTCNICRTPVTDKTITKIGSKIKVEWRCYNRHSGEWSSCPNVRAMSENNLLTTASILFTGATYTDVADWAELLNLQLPKKATFYDIQACYLMPAIEEAYNEQERNVVSMLRRKNLEGEKVELCGDARCDSPGYSCKYLTYSFMDDATKEIIHIDLMQGNQAKSSTAMEPIAFVNGMEQILAKGVQVKVVTTDRHVSIRKIMKDGLEVKDGTEGHTKELGIMHEFDPWHTSKGVKKKLLAASKRKGNEELHPWIKSVSNHMWWCCSSSKGDAQDLIRRWKSVLHHIRGVHRWEEDGEELCCYHEPLPEETQRRKRWLEEDSPAFKALQSVVNDNKLLADLQHISLSKNSGDLEVFHNVILKYCPKRLHFSYPSMKCRTMLAVLDWNETHREERQLATTASGIPRPDVVHSNQPAQRIDGNIHTATLQPFRKDLVERVLHRRLKAAVKFRNSSSHMKVPQLAANTARTPKPALEDPVPAKRSRFREENPPEG